MHQETTRNHLLYLFLDALPVDDVNKVCTYFDSDHPFSKKEIYGTLVTTVSGIRTDCTDSSTKSMINSHVA